MLGRKIGLKRIIFYVAFNLSYSRDKYNHNRVVLLRIIMTQLCICVYHLILKPSASQLHKIKDSLHRLTEDARKD